MNEVQQNGLASEEEALGDVPTPQATPLAPPTTSGNAAQPDIPATHLLQGEADGPGPESEAYTMETQEPETAKGIIHVINTMYMYIYMYMYIHMYNVHVHLCSWSHMCVAH